MVALLICVSVVPLIALAVYGGVFRRLATLAGLIAAFRLGCIWMLLFGRVSFFSLFPLLVIYPELWFYIQFKRRDDSIADGLMLSALVGIGSVLIASVIAGVGWGLARWMASRGAMPRR